MASRPILSDVALLGRTLRNRLAVAPMSRVSATDDGLATNRMKRYYREFARGCFGVVITEGTYTDEDASQGYDRQPGIAKRTASEVLGSRRQRDCRGGELGDYATDARRSIVTAEPHRSHHRPISGSAPW